MDAKKVAEVAKPKYFKETNAHRFATYIGVFGVLWTVGGYYLYYRRSLTHPHRLYTDNFFLRITESVAYKTLRGMSLGYLPPPRAFREKYDPKIENYGKDEYP